MKVSKKAIAESVMRALKKVLKESEEGSINDIIEIFNENAQRYEEYARRYAFAAKAIPSIINNFIAQLAEDYGIKVSVTRYDIDSDSITAFVNVMGVDQQMKASYDEEYDDELYIDSMAMELSDNIQNASQGIFDGVRFRNYGGMAGFEFEFSPYCAPEFD